jgi:hypothetical protein
VSKAERPPDECANCGARIPRGAKSCPECGADERTGWRERSVYDDLDLPDEAYTDDAAASPGRPPPDRRVNGIAWYWWCIGVAVLIIGGLKLVRLL